MQREIDKLRGSIQTLTRSVNPLGKMMDFVQEDLDSMQKELEMWKRENKQNATELHHEQKYVRTWQKYFNLFIVMNILNIARHVMYLFLTMKDPPKRVTDFYKKTVHVCTLQ